MAAVGLGTVSGCGSDKAGDEKETGGDAELSASRARQVATAWGGSTAAASWCAGYYSMGRRFGRRGAT